MKGNELVKKVSELLMEGSRGEFWAGRRKSVFKGTVEVCEVDREMWWSKVKRVDLTCAG